MKVTWYITLSGDMQWSDYKNGNSDPLGDIKNVIIGIRERFGKQPNLIKTSRDVLLVFMGHPDVVAITPTYADAKDYSYSLMSKSVIKSLYGLKIEIDEDMKDRMLIAYKENGKIPDENAMYEIRGIL